MAGDWIMMQMDLDSRREVLLLCKHTGWSKFEVIGRLWHFWSWVSRESGDGQLRGVDTAVLSEVLGVPEKFLQGLVAVGWLEAVSDGLIVPNYDRWFSNSAKIRLGDQVRWKTRRSPGRDSGGNSGGDSGGTPEVEKRREEKNKKPPTEVCGKPPPLCRDGPASEFAFPVRGKGPTQWSLPEGKLQEYIEAFPGLDVEGELRRARQWARDNPLKRKTASGMLAFLTRWLSKAANDPKGNHGSNTHAPGPGQRHPDDRDPFA